MLYNIIFEEVGYKKINFEQLYFKFSNYENTLTNKENELLEKILCPICKDNGRNLVMDFIENIPFTNLSEFLCDRCGCRYKISNIISRLPRGTKLDNFIK